MTDREALLKAVRDDPKDDTVRLAYADWLDENGMDRPWDEWRAEFIRRQVRIAVLEAQNPKKRAKLYKELTTLREEDRKQLRFCGTHWQPEMGRARRWRDDYPDGSPLFGYRIRKGSGGAEIRIAYRRGFIDEIGLSQQMFLLWAGKLFRENPITRVTLDGADPAGPWERWLGAPNLTGRYWWCGTRQLPVVNFLLHHIVDQLFTRIPRPECREEGYALFFKTAAACREALNTACVAYGREQATLLREPKPKSKPRTRTRK